MIKLNNSDFSRLSGILGLAKKAGKISSGTEQVIDSVRKGKAKLVLYAKDLSENTVKKIQNSCDYYEVQYMELPFDMSYLSEIIGRLCNTSSISIEDAGFKKSICNIMKTDSQNKQKRGDSL